MLISAIIVSSFSLASRILGLFRDRLLASNIGASDLLDTYYAAFRLPDLVFNAFILGALGSAFIPVFLGIHSKDKQSAWSLASTLLNYVTLVSVLVGALAYIFAPSLVFILAPGFDPIKQHATVGLTRIMLLGIVFLGISNVLSSVLNSFNKFFATSLSPVFYNLGIIFGILVLYPRIGPNGLAYGVVIGAIAHLMIQIPAALAGGFSWRPIFGFTKDVQQVLKLMIPRTFALIATQLNATISIVIGSTLGTGSVAIFNLASNLQTFPIGLIGIPFAMTAFPALAQAWADNDLAKFSKAFSLTFRRILFFIVPVSIFLLLLRAHIVRLVLGAGVFDWRQTILTSRTLGYFAISIFAQALIPVVARAFYAVKDTKTPVLVSISYMAINAVLSWKLSGIMGISGLALSFSLVTIAQLSTLWFILRLRLGDLSDDVIWESALKISLASVVSGLGLYGTLWMVNPLVDTHTYVGLLVQAFSAFLVGSIIYMIFMYSWGKKEILYE